MLKISGLSVYYGKIQALKEVDLEVGQGEIVTLIGANGAGKSTLLKTISGITLAKTGVIRYLDRPITNYPAQAIVKAGISHVPEGRRVFANLTVEENLELGAFLKKDKKEVREMLDKVYDIFPRLKERRKQLAGTLSGGEQQMLALGRGLMSKPQLLLLDEPSMGLAPILVQTIFSIIKEINQQGTTILLVEQNANMALSIADRAYVLETGRVVLSGTASELRESEQIKAAYLGGR